MSETPKCPGCGADMRLMLLTCYACMKCGWLSPTGIDRESANRMAMRRVEPINRVLTIDELKQHCSDGASAAPLWVDFRSGVSRWVLIAPLEYSCVLEFVSVYLSIMGAQYGKSWRCWIRKPTDEEMERIPWS